MLHSLVQTGEHIRQLGHTLPERGICPEVNPGSLNWGLQSSFFFLIFFIRSQISPKPQPGDPLEFSFYTAWQGLSKAPLPDS